MTVTFRDPAPPDLGDVNHGHVPQLGARDGVDLPLSRE